jgi:hypothetical protein
MRAAPGGEASRLWLRLAAAAFGVRRPPVPARADRGGEPRPASTSPYSEPANRPRRRPADHAGRERAGTGQDLAACSVRPSLSPQTKALWRIYLGQAPGQELPLGLAAGQVQCLSVRQCGFSGPSQPLEQFCLDRRPVLAASESAALFQFLDLQESVLRSADLRTSARRPYMSLHADRC